VKLSKAWCGLFTLVSAGVGLTAYLAQKGSELCESSSNKVINSILDASINLSGFNTTISIQNFPTPLHVSLGDLNFNLRHTLAKNLVETLENTPHNLNDACKAFIWEQGATILLICGGLAGLGIYTYKKFKAKEALLRAEESIDLDYHSDFSINPLGHQ